MSLASCELTDQLLIHVQINGSTISSYADLQSLLTDQLLFDVQTDTAIVIQWGTKGLQCCTLLGLLAYISRNKIEQILKIFEMMNVFLGFNMM
jgi:hypothetical protein